MKRSLKTGLFFLALIAVSLCSAQPQVSIQLIKDEDTVMIRLNWEETANAESYDIYASSTPYLDDWGEPIATLEGQTTEYIIEETINELNVTQFYRLTVFIPPIPPNDRLIFVNEGEFGNNEVIVNPFFIGKYEVTQTEFLDIMGEREFAFTNNRNLPAESLSWFDAIEYCNRLSIREGLIPAYTYSDRADPDLWYADYPGWNEDRNNHLNISCNWEADGYRLPTETEWNHAANAGIHPPPFTYAGSNDIDEVARYNGNAAGTSHPVGELAPNALGIYDMTGNVFEWCWDIYGDNWPPDTDNPHGSDNGIYRVRNSSGWNSPAPFSRLTGRHYGYPSEIAANIGFRICRNTL